MKQTSFSLTDVVNYVGKTLGPSAWIQVTQQRINDFAQATGDFQWIHVNPELARQSPFKNTIAHGYLTLSLIPKMFEDVLDILDSRMGINYGLNKVRFPAVVPSESHIRGHFQLLSAEWTSKNCLKTIFEVTIECDAQDKPVCIAEIIALRYMDEQNTKD